MAEQKTGEACGSKRKRAVKAIVPYVCDKNLPYAVCTDAAAADVGSSPVDARQTLDVYVPAGNASDAEGFPVIVFLHGGKLTHGDKSKDVHVAKAFAKHGYVVVLANYRLSPQVSHPEHTRDAAAALEWVHANIGEYEGNAGDVTLLGFSAGAYLASLLLADAPTFLPEHAAGNKRAHRAVFLSGFYRIDRVAPGRDESVWGSDAADWRQASPYYKYENLSEEERFACTLVPSLFLYGDRDEKARKEENIDMSRLLESLPEADVELHEIEKRGHVDLWRKIQATGDTVVDTIVSWLSRKRS